MNDPETILESARLSAPSAEFERRMTATFAAATHPHRRPRATLLWLSLAAMTATTVVTVLLSVAGRPPRPAPVPLTYRFEAQGRLRQMLLNAAAIQDAPAHFEIRIDHP